MTLNIILAGVGGQGILTIAQAISLAALRRNMHIKQSEVHGMAQRGGAVQAHLRLSDGEIFSDLVPVGQADMILAVEPLEALRYVSYLRPDGVIVAATNAFVNITNYPPIEQVLERIAGFPRHVLLDADALAQSVGSARAANAVMLGAASAHLNLDAADLEAALAEMFDAKGSKVVEMNRRALQLGRRAAQLYADAIHHGGEARTVRRWLQTLPADTILSPQGATLPGLADVAIEDELSPAELAAVDNLLEHITEQGRNRLFEHEVYSLVELVGAISPPRHVFLERGDTMTAEALEAFRGDRVVLKLVSPEVVHKTEARAVVFARNDLATVNTEIERLIASQPASVTVAGVLVVEFVEGAGSGFGSELFVGIRASREFGPVVAAGLGGVDTEYLAAKMRPGIAVAKAVALDTTPQHFLELFKKTAAYDLLSGQVRGHRRIVSDGELLRCFRAFISIARRFCIDRGEGRPTLTELEVNPFAFRQQRMLPLDGRGYIGPVVRPPISRPIEKVPALLEPQSIAVLGVSATNMNFGRIILNNIKDCGFDPKRLFIIKENADQIDGIRCAPSVADLPMPVDLLVIAAGAAQLPSLISSVVDSGKTRACILIPGGVGETEDSADLMKEVREVILAGRSRPDRGPVFIGPNCLGIQSRPGRYDTFFIPPDRHDKRWSAPARRVALVSQSGAFIITRLSNLEFLDPALAVSFGNQLDTTISDITDSVAQRDDIDVIGVYCEGFNDLDGLAFLNAVERAASSGKTVIFYKAGRTASGRSAAAGHTAALAGDYDVCQAAATSAGAIVTETFKEFEQTLELAVAFHRKRVGGRRIAAITNAGLEAVAMADATVGARYELSMADLAEPTRQALRRTLERHKVDGLVNARNPLDLTPMSTERTYEECAKVFLAADEIDALVISCVPMAPELNTIASLLQRPESLAQRVPALFRQSDKPVLFVVDSGALYDPLARTIREAGVPVFRSCDQAIRSLGRYLCHRAPPAPVVVEPEPVDRVVSPGFSISLATA